MSNTNKKYTMWTEQEKVRLAQAVSQNSDNNRIKWQNIIPLFPNRSKQQIKSMYMNSVKFQIEKKTKQTDSNQYTMSNKILQNEVCDTNQEKIMYDNTEVMVQDGANTHNSSSSSTDKLALWTLYDIMKLPKPNPQETKPIENWTKREKGLLNIYATFYNKDWSHIHQVYYHNYTPQQLNTIFKHFNKEYDQFRRTVKSVQEWDQIQQLDLPIQSIYSVYNEALIASFKLGQMNSLFLQSNQQFNIFVSWTADELKSKLFPGDTFLEPSDFDHMDIQVMRKIQEMYDIPTIMKNCAIYIQNYQLQ